MQGTGIYVPAVVHISSSSYIFTCLCAPPADALYMTPLCLSAQ